MEFEIAAELLSENIDLVKEEFDRYIECYVEVGLPF